MKSGPFCSATSSGAMRRCSTSEALSTTTTATTGQERIPWSQLKKMQNRPKVTVWCGMTSDQVVGPFLLCSTMNVERYLDMLRDKVWSVVSTWENIDDLMFMQDSAPHFFFSFMSGGMPTFLGDGWVVVVHMNVQPGAQTWHRATYFFGGG